MADGTDTLSRVEEFHERTNTFYQFRALFLKDLTLQWRSWKTNLCQLLTPVIFIVFGGLMQVVVNIILAKHSSSIPGTEIPFPPINVGKMLSCNFSSNISDTPHDPGECYRYILNFYSEVDVNEIVEKLPFLVSYIPHLDYILLLQDMAMEPCQKVLFDLPFYYVGGTAASELGNLTVNSTTQRVSRTGLVGSMIPDSSFFDFPLDFDLHYQYDEENLTCPVEGPTLTVPTFWSVDNHAKLNEHMVKVVKDYNTWANLSTRSRNQYERTYAVTPLSGDQYIKVMKHIQNKSLERVKPQGGILLDMFDETDLSVEVGYTLEADDLALYKLRFGNYSNQMNISGSKVEVDVHRRNMLVNMVNNAVLKQLLNQSAGGDPPITTYIMPIPVENPQNVTIDIASILGGILYPFAYSFLIPVVMASIVKDKHEKHLIMMEQNGLSRWTYWLVTYTFNYLLFIPIAIEVGILSIIFKFRLFTQTNGLVLCLAFFLWGHAEVVLGFFLSNFFGRPRTAIIVGYLMVIAGIIIALLLEGLQIFPPDKTPFFLYMMYPPFAFYRILFYCLNACISMRCYGMGVLSPVGGLNLVTTAMLYLGGSTVLLFLLSMYLSYVLPGEYGVRKSPFFPITDTLMFLKHLLVRKSADTNLELDRTSSHTGLGMEDEDVDIDVQEEENEIGHSFPGRAPVVLYHLRKEYPSPGGGPPYVAVQSVSLAIKKNECFGLLGPNGAGKTTLISVLTGLYEPTSGKAMIAGYDLATEIDAIHHHLGVCPQFDIHHAELTAEEHLYFYARLKGVKWGKEKSVVEKALRQVNLYSSRKCKSKNLSGGMRRRLSVAMACIGNPDILILDEPTTGLDPASRRQVWDVIETVKEGRSVILTTHAMEEADHLCTRIGIMNFGKLRCLGTQTKLKARFGTGYQLTFNCAPGRVDLVKNFVQENIPHVVHTETYSDTCTFKLDKEHLKVSELFSLLNKEKTRLGILDWGVKMTTLEDVFLKIVKRHSDHRVPDGRYCLPAWVPFSSYCKVSGTGTETGTETETGTGTGTGTRTRE